MDGGEVETAGRAALERPTLLNEAVVVRPSTLDAVEGLQRVSRVLVPALADWCVADVLDADGRVQRVCVVHRDPKARVSDPIGTLPPLPVHPTGPLSRVLRGAGTVLLTEAEAPAAEEGADPFNAVNLEMFDRLGGHPLIEAPLRVRGRGLGALTAVRGPDGRCSRSLTWPSSRTWRTGWPWPWTAAACAPRPRTSRYGSSGPCCPLLPQRGNALIIQDVTGHDLQATVTVCDELLAGPPPTRTTTWHFSPCGCRARLLRDHPRVPRAGDHPARTPNPRPHRGQEG